MHIIVLGGSPSFCISFPERRLKTPSKQTKGRPSQSQASSNNVVEETKLIALVLLGEDVPFLCHPFSRVIA
jgi:hypothetical protein